jgi:hypothetical protein
LPLSAARQQGIVEIRILDSAQRHRALDLPDAAALHAAELGMRVTLIEKDKLGWTCLHKDCNDLAGNGKARILDTSGIVKGVAAKKRSRAPDTVRGGRRGAPGLSGKAAAQPQLIRSARRTSPIPQDPDFHSR